MSPKANLDVIEKRLTSCPYRKSNTDSSIVQPVVSLVSLNLYDLY
jgi:hypothetical protein